MLVYLKEPMGYTQIDGYRVHGRKYAYGSFGSTDLPLNVYKKNKNILEDAQYTKLWLENKFNKKFPDISFTISGLGRIKFATMVKLARSLGINYVWSGKNKPSIQEKNALKKSVISFLHK